MKAIDTNQNEARRTITFYTPDDNPVGFYLRSLRFPVVFFPSHRLYITPVSLTFSCQFVQSVLNYQKRFLVWVIAFILLPGNVKLRIAFLWCWHTDSFGIEMRPIAATLCGLLPSNCLLESYSYICCWNSSPCLFHLFCLTVDSDSDCGGLDVWKILMWHHNFKGQRSFLFALSCTIEINLTLPCCPSVTSFEHRESVLWSLCNTRIHPIRKSWTIKVKYIQNYFQHRVLSMGLGRFCPRQK